MNDCDVISHTRRKAKRRSAMIYAGVVIAAIIGTGTFVLSRRSAPAIAPEVDLSTCFAEVRKTIERDRAAVLDSPRSGDAWGTYGMTLDAHEFTREAASCYKTALALDHQEVLWPYLLAEKINASDPGQSIAYLKEALRRRPRDSQVNLVYAERLIDLGRCTEAKAALNIVSERDPKNIRGLWNLARIACREDRLDDAHDALQQAVKLAPQQAQLRELLLQVQFRKMQDGKSMTNMRPPEPLGDATASTRSWIDPYLERVSLRRRDPYWFLTVGEALLASGNVSEGLGYLRRAAETPETGIDLTIRYLEALLQLGKLREAKQAAEQARERFPNLPSLEAIRQQITSVGRIPSGGE